MQAYWLRCNVCGKVLENGGIRTSCSRCRGLLAVEYDYELLSNMLNRDALSATPPSMWKYTPILPVDRGCELVSLGEGGTFLQRGERLGEGLGHRNVWLKNEAANPTGSFLDRGVALEVSRLRCAGLSAVSCASRGNLGASVAAYSARAGMDCVIYTVYGVELGKLYQALVCGARIELKRNYDEALAAAEASGRKYHHIKVTNPCFLEGIKTVGLEICEQLGWKPPDFVVVPMGEGSLLSMLWKAMKELKHTGLLDGELPRIIGVQLKGHSPIVDAFKKGLQRPVTVKRSGVLFQEVAVEKPMLGELALRALRESRGYAIVVSEKRMLDAARLLACSEGILAEPAGALTVAATKEALDSGILDRNDCVVCIITGSGLKDPSSIKGLVGRSVGRGVIAEFLAPSVGKRLGRTKLLLLRTLKGRPSHGYALWRSLREEHSIRISLPSLYQHLQELMQAGLVNVVKECGPSERMKKVYSLTKKGEAALAMAQRLG